MQVFLFYIVSTYISCLQYTIVTAVCQNAFDTETFYIAFRLSRHGNM